ncbi:MAG: hypothetical protein ACRDCE_16605 [Cetobacterium sp.]|uniref:hypothetical protein n=1 Tax=Cetobacterium sp. TaxID=2071632 RepID=UPI003EE46C22
MEHQENTLITEEIKKVLDKKKNRKRLTAREKLILIDYDTKLLKEEAKKEEVTIRKKMFTAINKMNKDSILEFFEEEIKKHESNEIITINRGLWVFLNKNPDFLEEILKLGKEDLIENALGNLVFKRNQRVKKESLEVEK